MEQVELLFKFAGGVGMFLYGLHIMGEGLQKTAGDKMKKLLGYLTNNKLLAILAGAVITSVMQSSSATTVMVVGFVNAGIMSLTQAVGVIMGANIGTTVTAWIVSMSELGNLLKPEFFAPLLVGIAAFIVLFAKNDRRRTIGELLIGFGLLFVGLSYMSGAIKPFRDAPVFAAVFETLGAHPVLGILAGAAVTAIIQSSSASVGILQTLAMNGVVTWKSVVYITLGQNIGTCVTALLSSTGAKKNAKRAAVIHLMFNVIGAVLVGVFMFFLFQIKKDWGLLHAGSVDISVFHTVFNIVNTIVLFPFAGWLVRLSEIIVREDENEDEMNELLPHLDIRMLENPSLAVEQAEREVLRMGNMAVEQLRRCMDGVLAGSMKKIRQVIETEEVMDQTAGIISEYLVNLEKLSLTDRQNEEVSNLFYAVNDLERIGDHCDNIAGMALRMQEQKLQFSDKAMKGLNRIYTKTIDAVIQANVAREYRDMNAVKQTFSDEEKVDELEQELREGHIKRLSKNQCNAQSGIIYLDILSNMERIADHAVNLAEYIENEMG